MQWLLLYTDVT